MQLLVLHLDVILAVLTHISFFFKCKERFSLKYTQTHTHTHTHTHTYILYIYIYIYRQHFFVNANFIKHNRHFMSTYFLLDPFEFPYDFYRIRGGD